MSHWPLVINTLAIILLYIFSVPIIGHRLALSSWKAWNNRQKGPWAYFLFPFSAYLDRVGYCSRYAHFFNPQIVEIANSPEISLKNGHWSQEGRSQYLATTAIFWPFKILSCSLCCLIVLTLATLIRVIDYLVKFTSRLIYRWTGVV